MRSSVFVFAVLLAASAVQAQPPSARRSRGKPASAQAVRALRPLVASGGGAALPSTAAPSPLRSRPDGRSLDPLRLQAALDRAGFSPGVIDGKPGRKTELALRPYQAARGLRQSGIADAATCAALLADGALPATDTVTYLITAADIASVGVVPTDWNARAEKDFLPYESLSALLAERGHCSRATLARLNPGRDLDHLHAGDTVRLPPVDVLQATGDSRPAPEIATLLVDIVQKTVTPRDAQDRASGLFHCSVARSAEKLPRGEARVTKVALQPEYQFDPAYWPEVKTVKQKIIIPPGPRNPVGLAWIGLSLPGYGIHGTPTPELIGKTGSHGCIRLTNWDAVRLAGMVRVGMPVRFTGER